jgi:hypothetical protein
MLIFLTHQCDVAYQLENKKGNEHLQAEHSSVTMIVTTGPDKSSLTVFG